MLIQYVECGDCVRIRDNKWSSDMFEEVSTEDFCVFLDVARKLNIKVEQV